MDHSPRLLGKRDRGRRGALRGVCHRPARGPPNCLENHRDLGVSQQAKDRRQRGAVGERSRESRYFHRLGSPGLREGRRRFEPGLLARVNQGVLYVDEVNLLEDHIVDLLLARVRQQLKAQQIDLERALELLPPILQ